MTRTYAKLKRSLFFVTILFSLLNAQSLWSVDLFNESETGSMTLDDRIKALESSIQTKLPEGSELEIQNTTPDQDLDQTSIAESLDAAAVEQEVQLLKSEIIDLNKELAILEEALLSPISTQVALFLSINQGEFFDLDGVKVEINDRVVAHHLYTRQEVSALSKGALQRLHTDNLVPGDHKVVVILSGYSADGRDVKKAVGYDFHKSGEKKYIELSINDDPETQRVSFEFSEWQ